MKRKKSRILRIWYMEGRKSHFQFHILSRRFVYRLHSTMQGMRAWQKLSNYRRRSQTWYLINCGHDGHVYKTNTRTFMHSFDSHCHDGAFSWRIKFSFYHIFLHRLNDNAFYVYWQCIRYLRVFRYGSLVVVLSNFAGRH